MPYYTPIPDATIDLNAETPVLGLGNNLLLNELSSSTQFAQYDVDATEATTLSRGDEMSLVDANGDSLAAGTFAGTGTISTAAVGLNLGLASLSIELNPISGSFMTASDGTVQFVSDEPLDADHLGLKITGTIGIPPFDTSINLADINISDLADNALLAPFAGAIQDLLDTVVVNVAYDAEGTLPLDEDDVFPCFTAGTLIDTPRGTVAVETLTVGDLVLTADHGAQPIRWIGRRRFDAGKLAANPALVPVRIKAGALGPNQPAADLLVSPQHRILLRSRIARRMFGTDEILVAAKQLLLIEGVDLAHDLEAVEYVHLLFDRHEVVQANGAATESLYLGPQALESLPAKAVAEIMAIFPELAERLHEPLGARLLASGRQARKLAHRHAQNGQPLVA
ncbi:Hint domain-containing protein [Paracoccus sp. DMF]|uniref:Hint domain-containing protein n=1 Tax=Paracoccus sp. DMF TaxID=400837 RepID=UPI0021E3A80C|nr:Hint domain-containing protein [Paracoccus sp. DMF]MCV2447004.1 Hint domain-containing protein [Paracoccus sp. DMF]